jgi:hypothetical protein
MGNNMKFKESTVLISAAIAMGFLAISAGQPVADATEVGEMLELSVYPRTEKEIAAEQELAKEISNNNPEFTAPVELDKLFQSGRHTLLTIENELDDYVDADTKPVTLEEILKSAKGDSSSEFGDAPSDNQETNAAIEVEQTHYELAAYVQNSQLLDRAQSVFYVYTFANRFQNADEYTMYTHSLDGPSAYFMTQQLIAPRSMTVSENGILLPAVGDREIQFQVRRENAYRDSDREVPSGAVTFVEVSPTSTSFRPIEMALSITPNAHKEYEFTMRNGNQPLHGVMTFRKTELDSITVEIVIHDPATNVEKTTVLVYEKS